MSTFFLTYLFFFIFSVLSLFFSRFIYLFGGQSEHVVNDWDASASGYRGSSGSLQKSLLHTKMKWEQLWLKPVKPVKPLTQINIQFTYRHKVLARICPVQLYSHFSRQQKTVVHLQPNLVNSLFHKNRMK